MSGGEIAHQFNGVETKLPTSLYAVDPLAIPEISGSVNALRILKISLNSTREQISIHCDVDLVICETRDKLPSSACSVVDYQTGCATASWPCRHTRALDQVECLAIVDFGKLKEWRGEMFANVANAKVHHHGDRQVSTPRDRANLGKRCSLRSGRQHRTPLFKIYTLLNADTRGLATYIDARIICLLSYKYRTRVQRVDPTSRETRHICCSSCSDHHNFLPIHCRRQPIPRSDLKRNTSTV